MTDVQAIGYWIDADAPELPDPANHIDTSWDADERRAVANYLTGGKPVSTGAGCSLCRICRIPNGFEDFTDGVYQWPEGLAHYVLDHSVRLSDDFVRHALTSSLPVKSM